MGNVPDFAYRCLVCLEQLNQLWGYLPAPTLDAQQWWSNKTAPKDYEEYLAKGFKVVKSPLTQMR